MGTFPPRRQPFTLSGMLRTWQCRLGCRCGGCVRSWAPVHEEQDQDGKRRGCSPAVTAAPHSFHCRLRNSIRHVVYISSPFKTKLSRWSSQKPRHRENCHYPHSKVLIWLGSEWNYLQKLMLQKRPWTVQVRQPQGLLFFQVKKMNTQCTLWWRARLSSAYKPQHFPSHSWAGCLPALLSLSSTEVFR